MTRVRLKNTKSASFELAWALYELSFPEEERRTLDIQKKIMAHPDYHFEIVEQHETFVGFILWWQFKRLKYIEHFAIHHKMRRQGFGKSILKNFISSIEDVVILEIEPPMNEVCKARLAFYEELGFILNPHHYQQPPMRKNGKMIKLCIMTYPKPITASRLEEFNKNYKLKIYDPYLG